MSIITYNDVTLPYANITRFDQTAIGDDLSNTDHCLTKIEIQAQCVINASYLNQLYPALAGRTDMAAVAMMAIRDRLMRRRRPLSVTFGGIELIPGATAGIGTVDAANGPIPAVCQCLQLTNVTFLMNYTISGQFWENNLTNILTNPKTQNRKGNNVLFNRWTETVTLDASQYTTFVRDGKFRIRSDNKDGLIADELRSKMCLAGVRAGFVRTSSKYTVDPDGLAIGYHIEERQVFKLPPAPAFEASGEYAESTPRGGAIRRGAVRVKLRGPKTKIASQEILLQTAVEIGAAKLLIRGIEAGNEGFKILESASATINMYDNEVEFSAQAMMNAPQNKKFNIAGFNNITTFTPGSDNVHNRRIAYTHRGTADVLLRAAAYWDPNIPFAKLGEGGMHEPAGLEVGQAGKFKET
jgi:hypothetical protein